MIDLHQHTTFSDGIYSVEDIINLSVKRDLKIISVADHDTFESQKVAYAKAMALNLSYIYGVELSTLYNNTSVHVLGYFSSLPDMQFQEYVKNQRIIKTIKSMRLKEESSNIQGYYDLKEIVRIIHKNNGLAILAHPIVYHKKLDQLLSVLDGAECISPTFDLEYTDFIINKCEVKGLYCTAGSDLHDDSPSEDYNILCKKYYKNFEPFIHYMCKKSYSNRKKVN